MSRSQARGHPAVREAPVSLLADLKREGVKVTASVQSPKGLPSERKLRVTVIDPDGIAHTYTTDVRAKSSILDAIEEAEIEDTEGTP